MPREALSTPVWTGRGLSPREGLLRLTGNKLCLILDGKTIFDAPISELAITWPWYGFGCQFRAHAGGQEYFISFMHTNNTIASWCRGVQRGRFWRREIEACRA